MDISALSVEKDMFVETGKLACFHFEAAVGFVFCYPLL